MTVGFAGTAAPSGACVARVDRKGGSALRCPYRFGKRAGPKKRAAACAAFATTLAETLADPQPGVWSEGDVALMAAEHGFNGRVVAWDGRAARAEMWRLDAISARSRLRLDCNCTARWQRACDVRCHAEVIRDTLREGLVLGAYFWAGNEPLGGEPSPTARESPPWDWRDVMRYRHSDCEAWDPHMVRSVEHMESAIVWPPPM